METTTEIANALRQQADLVVLLAHLDPRAMEQYSTVLTDVDVVVGGHVTRKDEGPHLVGNAILNRSGTRGQTVGITRLIVSPHDEIVDFGGLNLTLVPGYPEDDLVRAEVDRVKEQSVKLRKEKVRASREERERKAAERKTESEKQPQARE